MHRQVVIFFLFFLCLITFFVAIPGSDFNILIKCNLHHQQMKKRMLQQGSPCINILRLLERKNKCRFWSDVTKLEQKATRKSVPSLPSSYIDHQWSLFTQCSLQHPRPQHTAVGVEVQGREITGNSAQMRGWFGSHYPGLNKRFSGLRLHRGVPITLLYIATFLEFAIYLKYLHITAL